MRIAIFCIMAGRTKHIHAECSFRFLAERLQTLAKRLVGETSEFVFRVQPQPRSQGSLLHVPTERERETGRRENPGTRLVEPQ